MHAIHTAHGPYKPNTKPRPRMWGQGRATHPVVEPKEDGHIARVVYMSKGEEHTVTRYFVTKDSALRWIEGYNKKT
jgi:hypothetical protein